MIGCPNVVKVHDWIKSEAPTGGSPESGRDKGYHFRILYDYYENGDLDELVEYYSRNE